MLPLCLLTRGPAKTVTKEEVIPGLASVRDGRGTLVLTGPGNAPVHVRTTLRIGRNILEITRETAPKGQPFVFRRAYTMVRTVSPDLR